MEEPASTTLVAPGQDLVLDSAGNLVISYTGGDRPEHND